MDVKFEQTQEVVGTEEPGVLHSMASQRVRHNLRSEQQQNIQILRTCNNAISKQNIFVTGGKKNEIGQLRFLFMLNHAKT